MKWKSFKRLFESSHEEKDFELVKAYFKERFECDCCIVGIASLVFPKRFQDICSIHCESCGKMTLYNREIVLKHAKDQ